jgi:dTDP-4-amino-4,6-dideoxygalactose transaminase
MTNIPIMRPKLPSSVRLLPYLEGIDQSRIYSNFGPLAAMLERRLAAQFGAPGDTVATVANGTLGLALALAAQGARPGRLCVAPAWTFVASAQAASMAGLVPYFVDVDRSTSALDPKTIDAVIGGAPGDVGAIMPVVPFGQPIDFIAWNRVQSSTGIPVVIDAAAGFDSLVATETPAVVSLHATKVFAIGEGGAVVSTDPSLIRSIRTRSNFGFYGSRDAIVPALNAKLSEYHAAVGNASLDEWAIARTEWMAAAAAYRRRLAGCEYVQLQEGFGHSWVSSVCVLNFAERMAAARVERSFQSAGIQTRHWWGFGAHAHSSTLHMPRAALPVTNRLASSTLGVPLFREMTSNDIDRVIQCIYDG